MAIPLKVFCCYAHEDQTMLEHLKNHVMPLQRQGQITVWSDTDLNAGVERENELHRHLESADIILLLISPDFMASDYCYSTEMARAIQRHNDGNARVIPILLRPTFWKNAPFERLQVVPTNARPVTSWPNHDDAFYDITEHVSQVLPERRAWLQSEAIEMLQTLTSHTLLVNSVAMSADGLTLASSSRRTIKLWNIQTGQLLHTFTKHRNVWSIALTADGLTLVSGSEDKTSKLWNIQMGQILHTFTGHTATITSVALSPDREMLASGSGDTTIKLWNVQTGQLLRTLTSHYYVRSVAFSADGKIVASNSTDYTIKLWNVQTGRLLHTLTDHTSLVQSIAFSTDGTTLASGGIDEDGIINLWNIQTGQLLHTLTGHTKIVNCVAFSGDGMLLASGSEDGEIRLWNAQTGQHLRTLTGHTGSVTSVVWSAHRLENRSSNQTAS